ncbi:MAG: phosphoribosylglycinamide formyltransferase [Desulfovibrionaceae bacterium]
MTLDVAVVVSGGGSNLQSIIDAVEAGRLDVGIRLVLSNKPDAHGLERARRHGIDTWAEPHEAYATRLDFDMALADAIEASGARLVVLAGYMRMVTPEFLARFPGRVVNIHPALLPSFPGVHGQTDAALHGVKIAGCTVHFVDEIMDNGPIIIQAAVPALPGEDGVTLAQRILELEHRIYPQALQWLAQGRVSVKGRFVYVNAPAIGETPLPALVTGAYLVNPPLEQGF